MGWFGATCNVGAGKTQPSKFEISSLLRFKRYADFTAGLSRGMGGLLKGLKKIWRRTKADLEKTT
jgi:hypothetical protein